MRPVLRRLYPQLACCVKINKTFQLFQCNFQTLSFWPIDTPAGMAKERAVLPGLEGEAK